MAKAELSKQRQLELMAERGIEHPTVGIRATKKVEEKNLCKDCIHCNPDMKNLSNYGMPIIGDCPHRRYRILINHDGCQDKFKRKA